jgi:hypothetical protein
MEFLFVTGMFRSGTTLLGRMLNAHPELAVASDPYMPFFKSFRSAVALGLGQRISAGAPLDDYYFRANAMALFRGVQNASLSLPLEEAALQEMTAAIAAHAGPYSPRIVPLLGQIVGATYSEAFQHMLDILAKCYGRPEARFVGMKEVWTDEFIPALARSLPGARFIQIVRDPRAVAASKNVTDEKYPWLFLGRQWRKLAALAHAYRADPELGERVCVIRYEDLVGAPGSSMMTICRFLGVEAREDMIDPRRYVDGVGNAWSQNSSFGGGRREFDRGGIDRWRDVLSTSERRYVEMVCAPEMTLHRYEHDVVTGSATRFEDVPGIGESRLAAWIRGLYPDDALSLNVETQVENLRYSMLARSEQPIDPQLVTGAFLYDSVFRDAARSMSAKPS